MLTFLQVLGVVLVAITMALSLAHALEWPGKRRLDKSTYVAVQPMYYPGFTIGGGIGEGGGLLALLVLVLLTPRATAAFWLTLAALIALAVAHALYWIWTAPVNNFWLADFKLKGFGARFFGARKPATNERTDWTALRDRWERSHAARAVFAMASLVLLATALAV